MRCSTRPASPHWCRRRWPRSTRCGRRGTTWRPTPTCATAAATGAAGTPASSVRGAARSSRCRTARTGSRSNTTPCTAACERWFEPIEPAVVASPAWQRGAARAWRGLASALRGAQPWYVEAHQFRIDTTDGIGRPTPEGAHRDGVDLVAVVLVGREGIKGGETRVFEADGPTRHALHDDRAVELPAARRRAGDPREHADPAARRARPPRHAGADAARGRLSGRRGRRPPPDRGRPARRGDVRSSWRCRSFERGCRAGSRLPGRCRPVLASPPRRCQDRPRSRDSSSSADSSPATAPVLPSTRVNRPSSSTRTAAMSYPTPGPSPPRRLRSRSPPPACWPAACRSPAASAATIRASPRPSPPPPSIRCWTRVRARSAAPSPAAR